MIGLQSRDFDRRLVDTSTDKPKLAVQPVILRGTPWRQGLEQFAVRTQAAMGWRFRKLFRTSTHQAEHGAEGSVARLAPSVALSFARSGKRRRLLNGFGGVSLNARLNRSLSNVCISAASAALYGR